MVYRNEDWPQVKRRMEAFWQRELIDRCCIAVIAPRQGCEAGPVDRGLAATLEAMDDPGEAVQRYLRQTEQIYYGGDALPYLCMNYGASGHAAYFGCPYQVLSNTVWFEPLIQDWDAQPLAFSWTNEMVQRQLKAAEVFAAASAGRFVIGAPDNAGHLDALAHLRGNEAILVDLAWDPGLIRQKLLPVTEAWHQVYEAVYQRTESANQGGSAVGWMGLWAPGRMAQLQSDISVMLSPQTFEQVEVYELVETTRHLDYAIYHLDGVDQLRHLDHLLAVDGIDAIQWTNVVNEPSYFHYIPQLRRIQQSGRGLHITVLHPSHVERLLQELDPAGLFLLASTATESEARRLVEKTVKWTCRRS